MTKKEIEFYCIACHRPCTLKTYNNETVRGREAFVGECPDCNGRVCRYKQDVEYADSTVTCKDCKTEVPKQFKFCGACGKEL